MKTSFLIFLFLGIATFWVGCASFGGLDACFTGAGTGITFQTLIGPDTAHPGKVSIFFKLDDKDGNGVANLTEDDFSFYEQGVNDDCHLLVSESEAARKIIKSPQEFQYNVTLVLDLSGSVVQNSLDNLKKAASDFIDISAYY
ncbi:MAG: hypothetical protein AAFN10_15905 [Bacteroidota bacterium]